MYKASKFETSIIRQSFKQPNCAGHISLDVLRHGIYSSGMWYTVLIPKKVFVPML